MKEPKHKSELDLLLDNDKQTAIFVDEKQKIEKGDPNKDIRFNPNLNDKEIDVVSRKNQLR